MEVLILFFIGAVVFNYIHEYGHFLAARLVKIKVSKAYWGVGPIFRRTTGREETEFLYGPFPVASVHFDVDSYRSANPIRRLIAAAGGPFMNFVATFLLFATAYLLYPSSHPPVIEVLERQGVAATAGLQSGDRILAVDGTETDRWQDVGTVLLKRVGSTGTLNLTVGRGDARHDYKIPIREWQASQALVNVFDSLGLRPRLADSTGDSNPVADVVMALADTVELGLSTAEAGVKMVFGSMSILNWGGALQTMQLGLDDYNLNFGDYLRLLGLFSMGFGIVNLLPGPILDGLAIVSAVTEWVTRRPIPSGAEIPMLVVGTIFSFGLIPVCIVHDVVRFTG